MQVYDISLPVNTPRLLNAPGRFFRYYSGTAGGSDESILVKDKSGTQGFILKPGQSVTLPASNDEWLISNYANAATITGKVVVGMGRLDDDRVQGAVLVQSGEFDRVMASKCFSTPIAVAASAGNYSMVQLLNPAASPVNAFISKLWVGATSNASDLLIRNYGTPLATLIELAYNKKVTYANGNCEGRRDQVAALVGTNILRVAAGFTQNQVIEFSEPIVLTPNRGLIVTTSVVNVGLSVSFEFVEEAI